MHEHVAETLSSPTNNKQPLLSLSLAVCVSRVTHEQKKKKKKKKGKERRENKERQEEKKKINTQKQEGNKGEKRK